MFNIDLVELLPFFLNVHFLCGFMLGVVHRIFYKNLLNDLERKNKEIERLETKLSNFIINDSAKYFDTPK
ncbi:hypothetical protein [Helicobacter winghamensis]|uniref:hypothetical protein n=1 Tax=Helicobacter winghamensis TaxID=157268 RepID=UPI0027A7203E